MMYKNPAGLLIAAVLILVFSGCATLQESMGDIMDPGSGDGELDESIVIAGIREALRVGTRNTVISTSQVDGYLGNRLISCLLYTSPSPRD